MNQNRKRWILALLAFVLAVSLTCPAFAAADQRLTRGEVVETLLTAADDYSPGLQKSDIIRGDGGGLNEERLVTRAEAMVMVARAFGPLPEPKGDAARTGYAGADFDDIPAWAAPEIGQLTAAGILAGDGQGRLNPNSPVTAEQLDLMIRRIWALKAGNLKDDYYAAVNKQWLENSQIPAGEAANGAMYEMTAKINGQVMEIIQQAAENKDAKGAEQQIGALYRGVLAVKQGQAEDLSPLKPYLEKIDAAGNMKELGEVRNLLSRELGLRPLGGFSLTVDFKDSSKYMLQFSTMSSDLPKEYFSAGGSVIDSYREALAELLKAGGREEAQAQAGAQRFMEMQRSLAEAAMGVEESGDVDKIYNLYTMDQLQALFPALDLKEMLAADGLKPEEKILVGDPGLLQAAASWYTDENLDVMKDAMRLTVIQGYGPTLSSKIDQINVRFQQAFYGVDGSKSPEEQAALIVQQLLGNQIGQVYVQRHFSPEAKEDVTAMVKEFIQVYQRRIQNLDWMSQATKDKAIRKLETMTIKIGYPDSWDSYLDDVELVGNYYQDALKMTLAGRSWQASCQGKPTDKSLWAMTAYTVNAYYNALANEIVFPAGILQAPFYDVNAPREQNLGGIGMIIAHEITHSFDNNGAKFDENGNAANWWQPQDYQRFQQLCDKVRQVYDGPEVAPGFANDGTKTLSENIADLGGMACVLETAKSLENPDYNLLFSSMARCWTLTSGRDYLQMLANLDVHSFNKVRVNRTIQNFEEFYQTYEIGPGDGMYLPPQDRAQIW